MLLYLSIRKKFKEGKYLVFFSLLEMVLAGGGVRAMA
jgi:hypothetical protein